MSYQPQQSVLYPQAGHRQTACILNIPAPHRSHTTAWLLVWAAGFLEAGADLSG